MIHHKHRQTSLSDESGFTILESLVGLLVAAFLLAAVAPVIVISVATRVQAKRIELATEAAKSYIDGLKSGIITTAPPTTNNKDVLLKDYPAPTLGTLTCNANNYCTSPSVDLYCVDVDGSGCSSTSSSDFVIQTFRYNVTSTTAEAKLGYSLGLRVYRVDAFADSTPLKKAPDKQTTFTGGLGDRKVPLVEMTTEITNKTTTFSDFCDRLKPTTTNDQSKC